MLPFQEKELIGIDLGSYSIKIARLKKSGHLYTLKGASCYKLPQKGSAGSPPLSAYLSELMSAQKLKGKEAAAVISGPTVTFRHLHLPMMPEKDLKEAVRWEIRKEVSIPANELSMDYVITSKERSSSNTISIIAFAARSGEVERLISLFRDAGVEIRVVEAVPTALLFAFDLSAHWEDGVNYGLLDIGEERSTIAVVKNRRLVFAREISFGGHDLTRSIAASMNKAEDEAEELKIAWGLRKDAPDGGVREGVAASLEILSAEIQRSFDYYQAQFREGSVSRLFISGGSARLKGLEGFMTENTGIPSFADDPFRNMNIHRGVDPQKLRTIAPCLTVAAGLSARMLQA